MLFEFVDFANARLAAALAGFRLPSGIFWLYFSGSLLLVAAGVALIVNKKARLAGNLFGHNDSASRVVCLPAYSSGESHRPCLVELFRRHPAV